MPLERDAYVTIDAFKIFMATVTDTLLKQVIDQEKKPMEETTYRCPLHSLENDLASKGEPSGPHEKPRSSTCVAPLRGSVQLLGNEQPWADHTDGLVGLMSCKSYRPDALWTRKMRTSSFPK